MKDSGLNFNIQEDLIMLRSFYGLSQEEFAKEIGVNRQIIAKTELGTTFPRVEFMNKLYGFCFKKGLRLNAQKELFYKDELSANHLLLTHASKDGIQGEISLDKTRGNSDFGKGFYCGDSYEKAVPFVSHFPTPSLYFIDFDPKGLKSKHFEVNNEWMLTIAYFRGRLEAFKQHPLIQKIAKSLTGIDYVIAPIADNRMFQIIDSFINGEITDEQCKHSLAATNLGMQYVFISSKSLKNISLLEKCFISDNEKEFCKQQQIAFQKEGIDKSKLARIQFRGKGKYIEELFQ